jgi:hypothetical protein
MRLLCLCLVLLLSGCDRFRYPCQDPENWETKQCQRPYCSATGTCPDQLTKPEEIKDESPKVDKPVPCNDAGAARCRN